MFCGDVPRPALALYAFAQGIPSLMVTGDHIPADRNGIKFYRSADELLKPDEAGMSRQTLHLGGGRFSEVGMLAVAEALPPVTDVEDAYAGRYLDHFGAGALSSTRIGIYQHSAVGRDLLAHIVMDLGAEISFHGRSETFAPVDTEAIRPEDVALARDLAAGGDFNAIISNDGDLDRLLIADETGLWMRGDVLGILCAERVGATGVVTPVSSNTALECSGRFATCRRTRVGSPYVIAAMSEELAAVSAQVCGYEANRDFLLGSAMPCFRSWQC
ncbi:hypothetical protein [Novosphingobium sp. PASSN1]|uniref:hypothetical protein n=1 Tax=Novosphingobium sp. PASSN1 TaxID=2015561 RepID=UPI0025D832D3|nr:hypothetical protein [Novosphingobium sp. PASSN1]